LADVNYKIKFTSDMSELKKQFQEIQKVIKQSVPLFDKDSNKKAANSLLLQVESGIQRMSTDTQN